MTDLAKDDCSLYEFLSFLDITDIEEHIQEKYYKRKQKYPINVMIRLAASYYTNDLGYEKTIMALSDFDITLLKLITIPPKSTLHDFINKRLKLSGIKKVMELLAVKLSKLTKKQNMSHDSTPIEASRYDLNADFNPHYTCNMYKSHITMIDTIPIYMTFTNGLKHDSPQLKPHAYKLNELNITGELMTLDAAYKSYENHALVKYVIGGTPYIALLSNAVLNKNGTLDEINYWCQKLWKQGGSKLKTIEEKLQFLYNQGRVSQVGAYFRNNNIHCLPTEIMQLRSRQERIHAHIKNTVKFDVRGRNNSKKELHITTAFVSYQILCLCSLQNNINPNEFGFIN